MSPKSMVSCPQVEKVLRIQNLLRTLVLLITSGCEYNKNDIASAINCWMTPGTVDDTYVTPIIEGVKSGAIDLARLKGNIRYLLRVVQKRTGKEYI